MNRPVRQYLINSPEASARAIYMITMIDGAFGTHQIAALTRVRAFSLLNLSPAAFVRVAREYCLDLLASADEEHRIRLVDPERIDAVLEPVVDPVRRMQVCAIALGILAMERNLETMEVEVLRYVLEHWQLPIEAVHANAMRTREPASEDDEAMPLAA